MKLLLLAEFKPISTSRAWVSIPNPNGIPLIATATSDKTARVYSLKNFTLHSTLDGGHARSVRSVAWKPSKGTRNEVLSLATGSFDATMGIWRKKIEDNLNGHEGDSAVAGFLEVEITSEGGVKSLPRLYSGDSEADEDWEFAIVLEGHDSEVKTVSYSPSGQWLASCSRDKSIWIWEEVGEEGDDEFETVAVLQEHTADVKFVCWREDDGNGEVLASASYDDTIRLWREDGEGEWNSVALLEGHDGTVWGLGWEPEASQKKFDTVDAAPKAEDGPPRTPRLASCSADSTIRIWSLAASPLPPNRPSYYNPSIPSTMRPAPSREIWECTATLPKAHELAIYSIHWSPVTGRIVSTGSDSRVVVYEERTKGRTSVGGVIETEWVILCILGGAHGPYEINHVTWSKRFDPARKDADDEMVITTGDDGVVRAWAVDLAEQR